MLVSPAFDSFPYKLLTHAIADFFTYPICTLFNFNRFFFRFKTPSTRSVSVFDCLVFFFHFNITKIKKWYASSTSEHSVPEVFEIFLTKQFNL